MLIVPSKLRAYLASLGVLSLFVWNTGRIRLFLLAMAGLVSSIFYLLAFVLCIKVVSSPELLSPFVGDELARPFAVALVAVVLGLWAVCTKIYRVGLVRLERKVSAGVLKEIVMYQQKPFAADVDLGAWRLEHNRLLATYPKQMGRQAKSLFMLVLVVPVLSVVIAALFYINSTFTMFLMGALLAIVALMPGMQKKTRSLKRLLEEEQKQNSQEFRDLNARFMRDPLVDSFQAEYVENYHAVDKLTVGVVKSEESGLLLVNFFSSITIVALLLWFVLSSEGMSAEQVSSVLIYLILARFFSSYCNSLFKYLSALNSGLNILNEVRCLVGAGRKG